MYKSHFAVYLGEEKPHGFSGFVAGDNFFCILEAVGDYGKEDGRHFLKELSQSLLEQQVENLGQFEQIIVEKTQEANLPLTFSVAAGYLKDQLFYLKTVGEAQIMVRRGNHFAKLISGNSSASGYVKSTDLFIFSSTNFVDKVGNLDKLKAITHKKKTNEIVDELSLILKSNSDSGLVSLFVEFDEQQTVITKTQEDKEIIDVPIQQKQVFLDNLKKSWEEYRLRFSSKKRITFLVVGIILVIFIWSVLLGFKRKTEAEAQAKIRSVNELITQKLDQATEVASLNLPRAQILIFEAKEELKKLKSALGDKKQKDIDKIAVLIDQKENEIVKKEEKKPEEFFDLTVDNKSAKGNVLFLEGDQLSILDKVQGIIYKLSLAKKSLDKINSSELKKASLIATYEDVSFFFTKGAGIYKFDDNKKAQKIIGNDKDWGGIISLWIFNGNIYLMDKGKDQIYKYLVAENGYSDKTSYFKSGQAISLSGANSLAIDSSVYIGFSNNIVKFSSGERNGFKTSYPVEDINIDKIFTIKEVTGVYVWDRQKGIIYILSKDGTYEKQVTASILKTGSDLVVYENNAYIIWGSKIYKINLE